MAREGGAERADTDAKWAAVKRTGQPREGGAEGVRALSWERVRPVSYGCVGQP